MSDFELPELTGNEFIFVKPPSLWYFVMTDLGNNTRGKNMVP